MIIKRQYVTFKELINKDSKFKSLIEYISSSWDNNYSNFFYSTLINQCFYQREMSWAMPKIGDLLKGLEKLDEESPYDNQLTYDDVTDVEIYQRSEEEITLLLINKFEDYKTIVAVKTIKN